MRTTDAIVRLPGATLADGLTTATSGPPDLALALRQHEAYVEALRAAGVAVTTLPPLDNFPDSCFVEDVAVCTPGCAVVSRPGAPSRRGEAAHIEAALAACYDRIERIEAPGRLENLKELMTALEEFANLQGFLEHVSLVMENDESGDDDKINLMTLHGAKGLEFDTVFLPGWEQGLFPHQRALDESGAKGLEEERRLAYVGLTRARTRAIVSFAASRRIYNQWQNAMPSRFVEELPADNVDHVVHSGLYGSRSASPRLLREEPRAFDGWRPRRRRVAVIEDASYQVAARDDGGAGLATGQRIFHQKFGYGRILDIDGSKLVIAFEKAGTKKVMANFVEAV